MQRLHRSPLYYLLVAVTVLGLSLLLSGCGLHRANLNGRTDFNLNLTGFAPQAGKPVYVKVSDATFSGPTVVGRTSARQISTGTFTVTIPGIIQTGHTYTIDIWLDTNADGQLDAGPKGSPAGVDLTWETSALGTSTGLNATFAYSTNYVSIMPW